MKTSSAVWSLLYGLGVLLGLMAPLALAVPQDIVFVFDNSGSMRRADPGFAARAAARSFLLDLPTDAQVAVVVFDEKVVLSVPLALVGDGKALGASLNGVDYRGPYTNSPAAVERALDELKTHAREGAQRSVVLMSDGIVDTGNAQVDVERRVWLRDKLTQEAAANHVRLFGLAFTKSADLSLMKSLATSTQGDYFHAYTLPELPSAFAKLRVALFQEPPVLAGAAAPPALPVAPAPTAEVAAPTTPSSAPALAAPALAAPTLAAPAAPAAPALAAPTLAAPALAAPTL
ncbi:MAG: VWA domain-containing protein, partial [Gammaproteobacteria bacterium]|nr:VWA domain-containing protein [Gammaproteobacteria bacterium]